MTTLRFQGQRPAVASHCWADILSFVVAQIVVLNVIKQSEEKLKVGAEKITEQR